MIYLGFRRIEYEDLDKFKEIRSHSYQWLSDPYDYDLEEYQEWFEEKTPRMYYWITLGNVEVGYFRIKHFTPGDKEANIGMDLHPFYRGKGLGKICYGEFIKFLKSIGVENIILYVLESNTKALRLYQNVGFQEVERKSLGDRGMSIKMKYYE